MSSGCGDVLSLEDLKKAKKHQLFEAEVITGKQGGVAGGADIDYATNQVTGQTQKTMPAILRDLGFDPASFDFTTGGTLTVNDRNKVVYDPVSHTWYSWAGALPKVVPAGTNPLMDANWKPQTDPSLRSDLANSGATPGTDLIGVAGGGNLTQFLNRFVIFLDRIDGVDPTGVLDSAPAINAALSTYANSGVRFIGNASSIYRQESTIIVPVGVHLDYNGGKIYDNVQGVIAASANRANHTFQIYDMENSIVENILYEAAPTRANTPGVPTCIFWVGGQYLGSELTKNITLRNFRTVTGSSVAGGIVVAALGELDGLKVSNFFIDGGDWGFGINLEYGDRPVDIATDLTMNNGKHPYNVEIDNFSGQNLLSCQGFLRTASCYNIEFRNCVGYNVKSFFYGYGGDRNISRFSQNVKLFNCKSKIHPGVLSAANAAFTFVIVNKDGSTGDPLPSWTNYDHVFIVENCEVMNNQTFGSSCMRVSGNKGKVVIRNCVLSRSYYGVWTGPSSNPDYITDTAVDIHSNVFKNNVRDLNIVSTNGVSICTNQLKAQTAGSAQTPVGIASSPRTKLRDNYMTAPSGSRPSVSIDSSSPNCVVDSNYFELFDTAAGFAVSSAARVYGQGNRTNGTAQNNLVEASSVTYGIRGEPNTMIRDAVLFNASQTLNADIAHTYTSANATTLTGITGGLTDDEILLRGVAAGSAVTLTHAAAGVSTENRLVLKGNVTRTVSGNDWSVKLRKLPGLGWYEV